ncbi:MAG: hypothetical protein GY803_13990 [Chloroflexi bacterium]|nr:hypothetical protein [Chloroflexota bacterium]
MASVATRKITVTLPVPLLERLNSITPSRQRSSFIAKAIQEQIALLEQMQAIDEAAGAWRDEDYPELSDDNAIDAWLQELRQGWRFEGFEGS